MKKSNELRKSLGLKQHEIALLLGINRAQWSMYESGKRRLPTQAQQKLFELLNQIETEKDTYKDRGKNPEENAVLEPHIKGLLQENEFERLLITRKLEAVTQKVAAEMGLSNVSEVLSKQLTKNKSVDISARSIASRAKKATHSTSKIPLFDLQRKLALLEYEKKYLESFLLITPKPDAHANEGGAPANK